MLLTAPVSHAGPALPRPGSAAFSGVLHLHGRIEDAGFPPSEYVLTSAEFGEAYLRSGWASRYIYDLARTHTLVLVGYGADDPPMRYLLEVLEDDRGRYPDMQPVHAFDAVEPARKAVVEALWHAKGIVPHLYDGTDAGSHTRFYATLRAWRDYAARPSRWRSERLSHIVRKPAAEFNNDDVKEALALLARVQTYLDMWNLSPHASWWARVIADGRLDASILGAWIASRADQEEMLQACIHKPPADVRAFDAVVRLANQNDPPLAEALARGWKLLARATRDAEQRPSVEVNGHWAHLRLKAETASKSEQHSAVDAILPRISISAPYDFEEPDEPSASRRNLIRAEFATFGSPTYRELLAAIPGKLELEASVFAIADRSLEDVLDLALDAGYLTPIDQVCYGIEALDRSPRHDWHDGFIPLVRFLADLWARIAQRDARLAHALASHWGLSAYGIRSRLLIHAFAHPKVFSPVEVAARIGLLEEREFWAGVAETEIHSVLRARWCDFSEQDRSRLEQRILSGPPPELFHDGGSQPELVRDWMVVKLLDSIRRSGGRLATETLEELDRLVERSPWAAALEQVVETDSPPEMTDIGETTRGFPLDGPLDQAKALERLRRMVGTGVAFLRGLSDLLSTATEESDGELSSLLLHLSAETWTTDVGAAVARWLWRRGRETKDIAQLPAFVLPIWDRAAEAVLDGEPSDDRLPTFDSAMNSPAGVVVLSLYTWIGRMRWRRGGGFGADLRSRLQRVVAAPRSAGAKARVVLVRDLAFLHDVDPEWAEEAFVSRLAPGHAEAPVLWAIRAGERIGSARLFNQLRPGFEAAVRGATEKRNDAVRLARNIIQLAIWKSGQDEAPYEFSRQDAKHMVQTAPKAIRLAISSELWRSIIIPEAVPEERARRWRDMIGPAFDYLWPLDKDVRDAETSKNLAWATLACDTAFPNAVAKMAVHIIPFEVRSIEGWLLPLNYGRDLPARFPEAFLHLLSHSIGLHPSCIPHDLAAMLDLLEPKLDKNTDLTAFSRLRRLQA